MKMKDSVYKSYDELPLFLSAKTVARVLGISPFGGYELMHQQDFTNTENREPHRGSQREVYPVGGEKHERW